MFFRKKKSNQQSASSNYQVISSQIATAGGFNGWLETEVAGRQDAAYRQLFEQAYHGQVRRDLQVAADAIVATGLTNPTFLEVGCGSGYYSEILSYLLRYRLRYCGVDNSDAMIHLAATKYPAQPFIRADATRLPFKDRSFDIVFNGVSLMHILQYDLAISEARRTGRYWCIFHTVPIVEHLSTTIMQKNVYSGGTTIEFAFNENELISLFIKNGLRIKSTVESIPYNLEAILGRKTTTRTYLCEILTL